MLALAYVALTAKPVSLRRLLMLFIVALALANVVFGLFHAKHASNAALVAAGAISLFAWSMPLVQLTYYQAQHRKLPIDALERVSGSVQWTYGFALGLVPMLALRVVIDARHYITFAELFQLTVAAGLVGATFARGFSSLARGL